MTRGETLVQWARARIRQALGGPIAIAPEAPWASEIVATFVTLRWRDGELQGCIGTLEPEREILADVAHNAFDRGGDARPAHQSRWCSPTSTSSTSRSRSCRRSR